MAVLFAWTRDPPGHLQPERIRRNPPLHSPVPPKLEPDSFPIRVPTTPTPAHPLVARSLFLGLLMAVRSQGSSATPRPRVTTQAASSLLRSPG